VSRHALLLAALAAALAPAAAAPAARAALAPAPTLLDFEAPTQGAAANSLYLGSGVSLSAPCFSTVGSASTSAAVPPPPDCGAVVAPGFDSNQSLDVYGQDVLTISFDQPQSSVSLWATATSFYGEGGNDVPITIEAWPGAPDVGTPIQRVVVPNGARPFGVPLVVAAPLGPPSIRSVRVFTGSCISDCGSEFFVDDISYSDQPQPDTEITSAPAATTSATDASFAFDANVIDTGFSCSVDGAPATACTPPFTLSGLALGAHSFAVAVRDRYGTTDSTPATYAWTVTPPPPPPPPTPAVTPVPPRDSDGDGVPDASDNCPAVANANQLDSDHDGIGDACETLPSGAQPPVDGTTVIADVISGDVFVKLPSSAKASSARTLFQVAAPLPGFVPLKGTAALPVGAVVDARKGALALTSTVDGRTIGAGGGKSQTARLSAGIFRIRQKRLRRGSTQKIPTDLVLTSAPGAEATCTRSGGSGGGSGATGPIKGRTGQVVRSLSVTTPAKGDFRIVGAAATSAGAGATWASRDRCDGTRTDVGRGKVTVYDDAKRRSVTVRAGQSYLAKAKLFGARKERQG